MQIDITTRYFVVVYLVLNRTQNQVVWKDTEIRSYRENNPSWKGREKQDRKKKIIPINILVLAKQEEFSFFLVMKLKTE